MNIFAENDARVKKAAEALAYYRLAEIDARNALLRASDSVRVAKEKYEQIFRREESAVAKRIKSL